MYNFIAFEFVLSVKILFFAIQTKMNVLFILLQSAATVADSTGKASTQKAAEAASAPLGEILLKGGVIMIPLVLVLLLALYFIVERIIYINKRSSLDYNMMSVVRDNLKENKPESATAYCARTPTAQAQVIATGLRFLGSNMREIESAMEARASVELSAMESNLHYLSLIGRVAPMIGFLGTIWGVINIFYSVATGGVLEIGAVSAGLYQKLVTSAGGLLVGMIAYIGYQLLMRRIDRFGEKLQEQTLMYLEMLSRSGV